MVLFDLVVHAGTLVSIVIVFRQTLAHWTRGLLRDLGIATVGAPAVSMPAGGRMHLRLAVLAAVTVGVTGGVGLVLYGVFAAVFERPLLIAATLAITGVILWSTDRLAPRRRGLRRLGPGTAVVIGLAQAAALLPGISRSGTTIAAGLYCGLRRRWAAEYSFLVAVPTIVAATVVQSREVFTSDEAFTIGWPALVVGFIVAAVVGTFALKLVLRLLYRARLRYFAYYVWAASAGVFAYVVGRSAGVG